MKISEVNAALKQPTASRNVKELLTLNNELRRLKYLFNSIGARRFSEDCPSETFTNVVKGLKSIKLGGIIKKCVTLQLYGPEKIETEYGFIDGWVYNIVASVDRLIGKMLLALSAIHNNRISSEKEEAALSEVSRAVKGVMNLVDPQVIKARTGKALAIVAANTETETADDAVDTTITADSAKTHTDASQTAETVQIIESTTETEKRGETSENGSQEHSTITTTTQTPGITYYIDSEYKDAI